MKKLIIAAIITAMCGTGMSAQISAEDQRADSLQTALDAANAKAERQKLNKKIWGNCRFFRLGYSLAQSADEYSPVEKGKYAFFLTKGTTYRFPKNPVGGLVKFGIDAVWMDLQFTKYNSPYDDMIWTSEIEDVYTNDDDDDDDTDEILDALNIGCMGISAGFGVGPNVSVAPFALSGIKGLQPLRASVYFHYAPTMQMYLRSQDGDIEISTAFCNMMNFGGTLTYRAISVGVEGRWGKGKFKPLDFSSFMGEDGDVSLGTQKYTRKFANTRIYIQFAF